MSWLADFADGPLFGSLASVAPSIAGRTVWPGLTELNRLAENSGLVNAAGRPVRFVAQTVRCGQRDYEAQILSTGRVPTRAENWHDLLNALVWLALPRTKAALNAVQCSALAAGGRRPPLSDAATLFDESGLVLLARDDGMAGLLRARRWREAFLDRRAAWCEVRCYVVGHALLEKALAPFPAMTAKCLALTSEALPAPDAPPPDWLDRAIAQRWTGGCVRTPADLFPLPVLGIPGVWPANEQPDFYADARVFRPSGRQRLQSA